MKDTEENVLILEELVIQPHTWQATIKGNAILTMEEKFVPNKFRRLIIRLILGWKYEKINKQQKDCAREVLSK